MAYRLRKKDKDKEKWKKELEKAGFSHCDGERIICYNCNVRPRSEEGENPAKLHAELCPDCKYVKDNNLVETLLQHLNEETGLQGARTSGADGNCARNGTTSFTGLPGNILPNVGTLPNPRLTDKDPRDRSKRYKELEKKAKCMNCFNEAPPYIFIPCRHVFCPECADGQSQCMKCGNAIEKIEWFYRG